jgi:two-component system CheB/CheR fusion protein
MDGYAVARALRSEPATREAWLVALTGYALPDDLRRAEEAGFDRHLAKPLGVGTLESAIAVPRGRGAVPLPRTGAGQLPGAGM